MLDFFKFIGLVEDVYSQYKIREIKRFCGGKK
jgi:hypothetical protein